MNVGGGEETLTEGIGSLTANGVPMNPLLWNEIHSILTTNWTKLFPKLF